jgi:hypothetical protein
MRAMLPCLKNLGQHGDFALPRVVVRQNRRGVNVVVSVVVNRIDDSTLTLTLRC